MSGSWRDSALKTMFSVYAEQQASGVTCRQQIADAIDKSYPFGERAHWPYKAWLDARKWFFATHGLPRNKQKPKADLLYGI